MTSTSKLEGYIIKNLMVNNSFTLNYLQKLHPDFFSDKYKEIIKGIHAFYKKNQRSPNKEILCDIILPKVISSDDKKLAATIDLVESIGLVTIETTDLKIIEEETQLFIKRNVYIKAITDGVDLIKSNKFDEIVSLFDSALEKLSFNDDFGLDYFSDLEGRLERAATLNEATSTTYPSLDRLMGGGYRSKALFIYAGPANTGKTLVLNDSAANLVMQGKNVVYFTLELAQDYIAQRTDAKYSQVSMNEINASPEMALKKAILKRDENKTKNKKVGKLIYKYYGPNTVSSNDMYALIKNMEMKMGIKFDFVFVDYLKLLKPNGKLYSDNMYGKLEAVCQELRGMAAELDVCVVTASQTTRDSYNSNQIGMAQMSDSLGIAQTADVIITLIRNDQMNEQNLMMLQLAKSRFSRNEGSVTMKVDYDYMRLIDVDEKDGQTNLRKNITIAGPKNVKQEKKEVRVRVAEGDEDYENSPIPKTTPKATTQVEEVF